MARANTVRNDVVLSPQEQRIRLSKGEAFLQKGTTKSRIEKIYDSFKKARSSVDIQRAAYFTESFKATEGQPLPLRWAKALHHIVEHIDVSIDDHQLIVGRAGRSGKYGLIYPELDGCFLKQFIQQSKTRAESPFDVRDDDVQILEEEVYPYWSGKTYYEDFSKTLPPDILKLTYEPDDLFTSRFIVNETSSMRSGLQWVHDYQKGLEIGFLQIKKDAEEHLQALDKDVTNERADTRSFWQAIAIVADAIILWTERYSHKAQELAFQETNLQRKNELLQISKICARVPKYPARTFHEAVQAQWFMQLFSRMEQKAGGTVSNGRMDQYLYPYYQRDIQKGVLTKQGAKELLDCLWLNMAQYVDLYVSPAGVKFNEGYAHWEAVTIGGVTRDGKDAVNELTYLFLEDKREFPLNYPDLAARVNEKNPLSYIREIALTVKAGTGFPKLINDEEIIPLLQRKGANSADARDYAVSGCTEARMPNIDTYTSPCPNLNLGAAVELTLHNGRLPRYGQELLTIETGNPESFTTWAEFERAFIRQEQFLLQTAFRQQSYVDAIRPNHFATPFASALNQTCLRAEKDLQTRHIEGGIDFGYFDMIGYGSATDSLAAIKKNVYEKKYFSIAQLKQALAADFEGYEVIRQRLLNAPKYGNDDAYADTIAQKIDDIASIAAAANQKKTGVYMDVRYVPVTSHIPFGKVTGALPNGRKAHQALSDGSSASQGADVQGPTAVLMSNYHTKTTEIPNRAARLLNIKLNPSTVRGEAGTEKLMAFIKSWLALKLWHLQFNIINRETLEAAKDHPEDYRSLLVRVAGYSAYFVELTKELQEDIIQRTEYAAL